MFTRTKKLLLILLVFLFSVTSGCSKSKEIQKTNQISERKIKIADLEELYSYKLPFLISDVSVEKYIDSTQTVDNYFKISDEVDMNGRSTNVQNISRQEAIEDIERYFSYLKDGYAGYLANGGDKAFLKAKNSVIDNLTDEMDSIKLSNLLEDAMKFVEDAHFVIGKQDTMSRAKKWYYVEGLQIGKNEDGYYNLKTEEYIKNKEELEGFLQPSLNQEGELCFILVASEEDLDDVPEELIYNDNSKFHFKFSQVRSQVSRDLDAVYINESIPYLHIKQFYMGNEEENVELVLKAAKEISEAPIAILDLRGNFGGNGILARQWIEAYSGEKFQTSANTVSIISEKIFKDDPSGQTWEEYREVYEEEIYDDNHTIEKSSSKIIEKDNKLIVLTDSYTGSSAEHMVDSLHHLNNTLFIGMPTFGSANGSILFTAILPNSKISFGFGNSWSQFNEEYYKEFNGFKPDIWVPYIDIDKLTIYLNKF